MPIESKSNVEQPALTMTAEHEFNPSGFAGLLSRACRPARFGLVARLAALPCLLGLGGCLEAGVSAIDPVPAYSKAASRSSNLLESALAACKVRNEAETAKCLKKGLADAGVPVTDLIGMIPNCHADQICRYAYTTRDRLGLIQAYAAELTIHWQISFDMRHAGLLAADVPITVTEVNV